MFCVCVEREWCTLERHFRRKYSFWWWKETSFLLRGQTQIHRKSKFGVKWFRFTKIFSARRDLYKQLYLFDLVRPCTQQHLSLLGSLVFIIDLDLYKYTDAKKFFFQKNGIMIKISWWIFFPIKVLKKYAFARVSAQWPLYIQTFPVGKIHGTRGEYGSQR